MDTLENKYNIAPATMWFLYEKQIFSNARDPPPLKPFSQDGPRMMQFLSMQIALENTLSPVTMSMILNSEFTLEFKVKMQVTSYGWVCSQ